VASQRLSGTARSRWGALGWKLDAMTEQEFIDAFVEAADRLAGRELTGVTSATTFESLELDSLDRLAVLTELEERLHVRIDEDEFAQIRTVGDVYERVTALLPAGEPTHE
jgi:acyl carrier protein